MDGTETAIKEAMTELCTSLDLPADLLESLSKDSDWSFIIKASALIESALNWSLAEHLLPAPLASHIANLTLNGRTGKISVGEQLGILGEDEVKFMRALSKVRNQVVHDVRHFNFTLTQYIASLDESAKTQFTRDALSYYEQPAEVISFFQKKPRPFMHKSVLNFLTILVLQTMTTQSKHESNQLKLELLEAKLAHAETAKSVLTKHSALPSSETV